MEAIVSLANSLTSPAKLILGAYVLLLWFESQSKTFHFGRCEFAVVAVLCAALQILHDDWARVLLNKHAERRDLLKRKELGLIRKDSRESLISLRVPSMYLRLGFWRFCRFRSIVFSVTYRAVEGCRRPIRPWAPSQLIPHQRLTATASLFWVRFALSSVSNRARGDRVPEFIDRGVDDTHLS